MSRRAHSSRWVDVGRPTRPMVRLRLRGGVHEPINAAPIAADAFAGWDAAAISATPLGVNHESATLGDVFEVAVIESSTAGVDLEVIAGVNVHHLGARQRRGVMVVDSDVGDHLASPTGSRPVGMAGGVIWVRGNAGNRLACRLRRGTVLVSGDCGEAPAALAVAGTVVVAGQIGTHSGFGMRRGTLVTAHRSRDIQGWTAPTPLRTPFASLLASRLPANGGFDPIARSLRQGDVTITRGDVRVGGQAEWWHLT